METFWKNEGARGRNPFERFKPRDRLNKPNLFATGCLLSGLRLAWSSLQADVRSGGVGAGRSRADPVRLEPIEDD
jgi:hypothetical protein